MKAFCITKRSIMQHVVGRLSFVFLFAFATVSGALAQPAPAPSPPDVEVHAAHEGRYEAALRQPSGRLSAASANFDATFYDLQLDIDFDGTRIAGLTRVTGVVVDEPIRTLRLDLAQTMEVAEVRNRQGASLGFAHQDDILSIDLGSDVPVGEMIDVHIEYAGIPAQTGLGSFTFGQVASGPVAWTLSEPYGAREWWPGRDHPSDKADSVRVTVTVPDGLRVGSNGLLVNETTDAGRSTFEWMHRYPISPYLVSIAAGPYVVFEQSYERPDSLAAYLGPLSLPVLHYVYDHEGETTVPSGWAEVVDMLAVFEHWFGPYPFPSEKYGHKQFTWGGGMEHQTMSSMGGSSILLVAHEVAHQWYGNLVTLQTWPHLWLNEGFASYAELLYWEEMAARYPGRFQMELETDMSRARLAPGTLVVQDTLNINNLFNGARVYAKGSVVLHMLRRMIGDATFREVLQSYAADPAVRYGTAVTADFHRIAERVSGQDLDAFFRQWVTDGFGHPIYDVSWSFDDADDTVIHVSVEQTQTLPQSNIDVFEMPITLRVETEAGSERFVVQNHARVQQYRLQLEARPVRVVFDPDLDLLRNAEVVVTDAAELPVVRTEVLAIFPNPASGSATLRYALDESAQARIRIFDVIGREVRRIDVPRRTAGVHEAELDVAGLAAGTYVVSLDIGRRSFTQTLVVSGSRR